MKRSAASSDRTNFREKSLARKIWKQEYRPESTDKTKRSKEELQDCNCYQFNPKCWATSGKIWNRHIDKCRKCKHWSTRECEIRLHSATDKRRILDEVSNGKATLSGIIKDKYGKTCCENGHCTHRFFSHKEKEVPWWACYNRDCEHHDLMKRKNGGRYYRQSQSKMLRIAHVSG